MLRIITIIIIVALISIIVAAANKPGVLEVERSQIIKASPEKIFALINNLKSWEAWSPFEKLDPSMKKTFSGTEEGQGAIYAWEGNMQAGSGKVEIIESDAPTKIVMKLNMLKPIAAENTVEFTLEEVNDATNVTWKMEGERNFFAKILSVIFNCDEQVGNQFQEGLNKLKEVAER